MSKESAKPAGKRIIQGLVLIAVIIGLALWSSGRYHYTGTIVSVQHVGRDENKVVVKTKGNQLIFSDQPNNLLGKYHCLNPVANTQKRYKITTAGFPWHIQLFKQNILSIKSAE